MEAPSLIEQLQALVPGAAVASAPSGDGTPAVLVPREHLVSLCTALRDTPGHDYTFLSELTCVDYWPQSPRFHVVYHLVSLGVRDFPRPGASETPRRLRLLVALDGADARVPTLSGVYPAADWAEREVYDLFGIVFDGHPDLRRILLPDEWEGHPLRKDYPVQVNVPVRTFAPLQVSEEEFVANIERLKASKSGR